MKRKYRIKKNVFTNQSNPHIVQVFYTVQVRNILGIWTNVKEFHDKDDPDFAKREALELYDMLIDN